MRPTTQTRALPLSDSRAWMSAALFVAGNIVLPQLCHLVPGGGLTLLPIYFFTLIGAYKYGAGVGLLTALLSPVANSLLFGMPPATLLPGILVKSVLLALAASYAAAHTRRARIAVLLGVVLAYQTAGSLAESVMLGSLAEGFQDFRIGVPGMLLQVFGGWLIINKTAD